MRIVGRLRRGWRRWRTFRRRRDGVAAIEFALVALPFTYLLFAIIETAYIYFVSIMIQGAALEGARQVRTGEVQLAASQITEFQNAVCNNVFTAMLSCNDLTFDVRNFSDFASINMQGTATFTPGNPGDVVVVRVMYQWNYITPFMEALLGADAFGTRHLVSSVALRNEPYEAP